MDNNEGLQIMYMLIGMGAFLALPIIAIGICIYFDNKNK